MNEPDPPEDSEADWTFDDDDIPSWSSPSDDGPEEEDIPTLSSSPLSYEAIEKSFAHIGESTIENASATRFDAAEASLELGLLMQSKANGDCAWFLLTKDDDRPLQTLCAIMCTPYCVLVEFLSAHGTFDQSILSSNPTSYFTYLKSIGYRSLSPGELEILNRH